MADISKINGQTIKDKTARDNHDALVKEVNETIEAINEALAELEYTLPVATSSALGGIKIGYTASGANLPVALSSEKAYVELTKSAVTSALGYTPASTDYYWANIKISSSSSNTTSPRFQSMRARNMVYGVARGSTTGTPTATILHTGIKWVSGGYMPVLHFTGYAYGLQSPVEFKVGFYIYSDKIGYCGATNMGAWKPEIRLFRETRNNVDYVAVALVGKCYFLGLSVGLQEEMANVSSNIDLSSDKWSFEFLTTYTTDDIPEGNTPPHATCCTVPYKQILNNLGNINFKLAGTTQATYTGADTSIDFNIPNATTSASGLMTAAMVTKLNGIAEGADNVSVTQTLTRGTEIGSVKVGNTTTKLYAPTATEVDLAGYATEKYVQNYVTEFEHALSDGYIDLSAYRFATKTELSNYVHGQALQEARVDLSAYKFISTERLKGLDTYSEDTFDINAGANGVYWKNTVAYLDKYNDIITQGTYYGLSPIVAGDNVTFTVDSTNQVVKVSANLSNYATTTYVDSAVSALVGGAPETLNALNELAAALGNDPNFATTVSTQIGKKQATITGAATTITNSNLTASRALVSDANGKVAVSAVTSTELGYLDGVTSNIQTQLNGTVKLAGAQTITGDKTTTGLFKIQNGAASGAFVLGADVNAKTLTANQRKLGRMGVPSYDSTTKTMAGISFDSQQYANYADFGGHPNNAASIAPDVIRFTVANKHDNTIAGARKLALQISNQAGLSDTSGGGTSVAGAKFFIPVIVDGNLSATSLTENGTALSSKYLGINAKATSATVADSANAVAWSKVSSKPTFATVATSGSYNDLSNKPTIPTTLPASDVYAWAKAKTKPSYSYSEITGKPTLATVATSGSYNDLSNKPTIPAAVSVTQKLTSGTEIGSVKIGSTTTKLYAPTATSVDLSGYLPLSGGTITGNILFSNSNAQSSQPNLKWKTINSKTPYVGYCTASADGTFLVASIGGTSYTTGLSIGGSSGNLLWKGTRVATTADIPSLSNYSTLANTIKALSISGKTITYTKGDGTTGTLTTQDTVYSLPTAGKNTLGGVKTTSTVTSASGYTACPIIGGVPYYKDTGATIGSILDVGSIKIDGENYSLENIDNPNNNIYLGDDTIEINGLSIGLFGDTFIGAQGRIDLLAGQDTGTYITLETVDADNKHIDISSDNTAIYGTRAIGLGVGENDEAFISAYLEDDGSGSIDVGAREIRLNGNVTVNGAPIGSGGNTKTPYATSSTAASTAAKVATISNNADNFSLAVGQRVAVKFTYANTAANPTLNVNSTGAKAIYGWDYTAITATEGWGAGDICEFMYNGTYWIWMNDMPYAAKSTSSGTTTGTKGAVRIRVYNGNLYIHTS